MEKRFVDQDGQERIVVSRIEEDGGGNLVISRLVGGKHKSHVFPSMKQHTGKQIFVLSVPLL
ncbi:hypothetical protein COOONC_25316 [Cooperia oncophora]